MKVNAKLLATGGAIAAIYVVLTIIASALGISSGIIQIRFSEALCILPVFSIAACPGLFIGCFLANLLSGAVIWDVIFGSLATLLGAIGTYLLRKNRWLAMLPPIISNTIIVPLILTFAYHLDKGFWVLVLSVGIGEVISCGILGQLLFTALSRHRNIFTP